MDYSYAEIEKAVRGKLTVPTRRKRFTGNVCIDSRTVGQGDLFVALKGPNFDGHKFIDDAFDKGVRLVIAEHKSFHRVKRKQGDVIFVDDTVQAFGRLASYHRRQFNIPVVAITGSVGKTTTKELIAHLLSKRYRVLKSEGTENNQIGVPKTLLKLRDHDVAVVEIGTNRMGEVRFLSRLTNPTHAVLTLIGSAHLAGFRNLQNIRNEKLSILDALEDGSTIVYNGDDKNISHKKLKRLKCIKAGFSRSCDYRAEKVILKETGAKFKMTKTGEIIETNLLGHHNILDILLAVAVATDLGVKPKELKERIQSFAAPSGRVRHREVFGVHWIDDSYNSNPTSLKAAIELFKTYPPKGRKVLVLGDMLELGHRASLFHREAGKSIARYKFDMIVTVGELSRSIVEGACTKRFSQKKVKSFGSSEEVGPFLKDFLQKDDTVLLKGSRGMQMEKILTYYAGDSNGE